MNSCKKKGIWLDESFTFKDHFGKSHHQLIFLYRNRSSFLVHHCKGRKPKFFLKKGLSLIILKNKNVKQLKMNLQIITHIYRITAKTHLLKHLRDKTLKMNMRQSLYLCVDEHVREIYQWSSNQIPASILPHISI